MHAEKEKKNSKTYKKTWKVELSESSKATPCGGGWRLRLHNAAARDVLFEGGLAKGGRIDRNGWE